MKPVETVRVHVMGETAGAADTGDHHRLFRRQLLVARQSLYGAENGVIAATGTPTRFGAFVIFERALAGRRRHVPILLETYHQFSFATGCSRRRNSFSMTPGGMGLPGTRDQQSMSTSVCERRICASCE